MAEDMSSQGEPRSMMRVDEKQKGVMWNVLEPGDPYDVRKSMIAKLPGDKKVFMGEHPEVVALLQAAQIERLHTYFEEYREHYLSLEKKELDRHSYEIQIRELTEKLSNSEQILIQNLKLKEFIGKQEAEIEQLKRNGNSNIAQKYESALNSVSLLTQENLQLQAENKLLKIDNESLNMQIEVIEKTKQQDLEAMKVRMEDSTHASSTKVNSSDNTNEKLFSEIKALEQENQKFSIQIDLKNHQLEDLLSRVKSLEKQNSELLVKKTQLSEKHEKDKESKVSLISRQLDITNSALRDQVVRGEEISKNLLRVSEENKRKDSENYALKLMIRQLEQEKHNASIDRRIIEGYDQKLTNAERQIDQLNKKLRNQIHSKEVIREDFQQLIYKSSAMPFLERENHELKQKCEQVNSLLRQTAEDRNKINYLFSQISQLQRVQNQNIAMKEELKKLKNQSIRLKNETEHVNEHWDRKLKSQLGAIQVRFNEKVAAIVRDNEAMARNKMNEAGVEIERLNSLLLRYRKQNDELKLQNRQLSNTTSLNANLTNKVRNLERELQENLRINELRYQQETKITHLQRQLEKAYEEINSQNTQTKRWATKKSEMEETLRKKDGELLDNKTKIIHLKDQIETLTKSKNSLQRDQKFLKEENMIIRGKLRELEFSTGAVQKEIIGYKNIINQITNQKELKMKELSEKERENQGLCRDLREMENLREQIRILKKENECLKGDMGKQKKKMDQEIVNLTNTYEIKLSQYQQSMYRRKDQLRSAEEKLRILKEIARDNQAKVDSLNYKLNLKASHEEMLTNENKDLKRDLDRLKSEQLALMRKIEQANNIIKNKQRELLDGTDQLERLNSLLQRKTEQQSHKEQKVKNLNMEFEVIKNREGYIQKDLQFYKEESKCLKEKADRLNEEIQEAQKKCESLNDQLNKVRNQLFEKQGILESLENKLEEKQNIGKKLEENICKERDGKRAVEEKVQQYSLAILEHQSKIKENELIISILKIDMEKAKDETQKLLKKYEEDTGCLQTEKLRSEQNLSRTNEELNKNKAQYEDLVLKTLGIDHKCRKLEKKNKIKEINDSESVKKIAFLEDEVSRMKMQKQQVSIKIMNEVRGEVEKIMRENAGLQNLNHQLLVELNMRKAKNLRLEEIQQDNENTIEKLQKQVENYKNKSIPKVLVKKLLKVSNADAEKREEFYEDELLRVRSQNDIVKEDLRSQVLKIMDELQKEQKRKVNYEEKVAYYEKTIDVLDHKILKLMEELTIKDNQIILGNQRYTEYKDKLQCLQSSNAEKQRSLEEYKRISEEVEEQNMFLKSQILKLKEYDWKMKDYQYKIQILEKNLAQLQNYNERIGRDYDFQNRKYQTLILQARDLEDLLQEISAKFRQVQQELHLSKTENFNLSKKNQIIEQLENDISKVQFEKLRMREQIQRLIKEKQILVSSNQENQRSLKKIYEAKLNDLEKIRSTQFEEETLKVNSNQGNDYSRFFEEIEELKQQISRLTIKVKEYSDEVMILKSSNTSLKEINENSSLKISQLTSEVQKLNDELDRRIAEAEMCVESTIKENAELRKRFEQFQGQKIKLSEYENKYKQLFEENKILGERLRNFEKDHEESSNKIIVLEEENRKNKMMVEEMRNSLNNAEKSVNQTKQNSSISSTELKKKISDISELNIKISQINRDLQRSQNQNSNLHDLVQEKQREIQGLKRDNRELHLLENNNKQTMTEDYRKLQIEYNALLREYETIKKKAAHNDETMKMVTVEFGRLQEIINKLKTERMSIIEKNRVLAGQIDRLNNVNRQVRRSLEEVKMSNSEKVLLEKRLQEQIKKNENLAVEMDFLKTQQKFKVNKVDETEDTLLDKFSTYRF